ncbi:MAG: hypothetical protein KGV43_03110 [Arcobacter sp.]|nr:hypothetical protein [Arcobacter sp.]
MGNIAINLLGQAIKTSLVGVITNKVVDTMVTSKLNKKSEHTKWRREVKLEMFSKLSNTILSFDIKNADATKERELKELCTKTILLLDDKKLIFKIENFLNNLNNTQRELIFSENDDKILDKFKQESLNLVIDLNKNLKKG